MLQVVIVLLSVSLVLAVASAQLEEKKPVEAKVEAMVEAKAETKAETKVEAKVQASEDEDLVGEESQVVVATQKPAESRQVESRVTEGQLSSGPDDADISFHLDSRGGVATFQGALPREELLETHDQLTAAFDNAADEARQAHTATGVETSVYSYTPYHWAYEVRAPSTGDHKSQVEHREVDGVVRGRYSVVEPDGSLRIVSYMAHPDDGFKATVQTQPNFQQPIQVQVYSGDQSQQQQRFSSLKQQGQQQQRFSSNLEQQEQRFGNQQQRFSSLDQQQQQQRFSSLGQQQQQRFSGQQRTQFNEQSQQQYSQRQQQYNSEQQQRYNNNEQQQRYNNNEQQQYKNQQERRYVAQNQQFNSQQQQHAGAQLFNARQQQQRQQYTTQQQQEQVGGVQRTQYNIQQQQQPLTNQQLQQLHFGNQQQVSSQQQTQYSTPQQQQLKAREQQQQYSRRQQAQYGIQQQQERQEQQQITGRLGTTSFSSNTQANQLQPGSVVVTPLTNTQYQASQDQLRNQAEYAVLPIVLRRVRKAD
ncbi:putative mediator of RNA polymerase II transcription subunit 26 [Homarus americanus]|uniref:putative mediator of RNA polymerase II transcription subunit 26 n=1 Tax=Homarus americanus TaxID=6706 RepID=UPI001C471A07|nr:putative mediator of RNA polymerase II transcription subunit 26 [Homarus americanus]